jgi:hypothetical protein
MRVDQIDDQIKIVQSHFKFTDNGAAINSTKLKVVMLSMYPSGSASTLLE